MTNLAEEAAGQLRTIRALMERSTIYRAVSAPAAGFAGLLSLGLCVWLWMQRDAEVPPSPTMFVLLWLAVLVLVSTLNTVLLWQSARKRGEAFISPGMKHALRALLPPMAAGFILGVLQLTGPLETNCYVDVAACWILFYGLALLATGSFSPQSMQSLGAGFFAMGILAFLPAVRRLTEESYPSAVIYMGLTFGVLHLIYAVAVFRLNRRGSTEDTISEA